jgi:DNA invertase Pin-like site-specific DNA recombinase
MKKSKTSPVGYSYARVSNPEQGREESQTTPVAYSYIRFSDPQQARGDSLRRQTEAAASWCERNEVHLDTSLTLHDKGCSGFKGLHRENPDKHALALFLKLVEKGRVRRGDYLLIENLDRLSREEEVPACHLLTGILVAGVRVVQMIPYEMTLTDKSNGWELMRAVMELSRGHGESQVKSERNGKEWRERLARARAGEKQRPRKKDGVVSEAINRNLPSWIEERGGRLVLIPERAAAVERIYQLAAAGYGVVRIVKALEAEGIKPFGGREQYTDEHGEVRWRAKKGDAYGSGAWSKAYVHKLLMDKRVLGTLQPLKGDGTPDGPPLKDYFPAVVTQEQWDDARAGAQRRGEQNAKKCNNSTKHIDVFAGLVRDARDGGAMFCTTRTAQGRHTRVYIPANGREGRIPSLTFPYPAFEDSILGMLREIPAEEIIGRNGTANEVSVLSGELARIEGELSEAKAFLNANGFSVTIGQHITDLEAKQADKIEKLTAARQRAAHPAAESWGEFQSLAHALKNADDPDDMRMRIRTALRRNVDSIWLLIVPRGQTRIAAVQIWFTGGKQHRDYLIVHRHALRGAAGEREAASWVASLADAADPAELDLRQREDTEALAELLAEMDLADLERGE